MSCLFWEYWAGPLNIIEITLNAQANVRLMDWSSFQQYKVGGSYQFFGGRAVATPVRLRPPRYGRWFVVVDLGGLIGQVQATSRLVA